MYIKCILVLHIRPKKRRSSVGLIRIKSKMKKKKILNIYEDHSTPGEKIIQVLNFLKLRFFGNKIV